MRHWRRVCRSIRREGHGQCNESSINGDGCCDWDLEAIQGCSREQQDQDRSPSDFFALIEPKRENTTPAAEAYGSGFGKGTGEFGNVI
jgi:hypothetical protein